MYSNGYYRICEKSLLRWWSLGAFLSYKRLVLLWRVVMLPSSSVCRQVVVKRIHELANGVHRMSSRSPVGDMISSLEEYGLLSKFMEYEQSGSLCSTMMWKRIVQNQISTTESCKWLAQIVMYKSMYMVERCVTNYIWPWWVFASRHPRYNRECKTLIRLVTNQHCLASVTAVRANNKRTQVSKLCQKCTMYVTEDVPHFLFVCDTQIIEGFWHTVGSAAPRGLLLEMRNMTPSDLATFTLFGFRLSYIPEWTNVYIAICKYIHATYTNKMREN